MRSVNIATACQRIADMAREWHSYSGDDVLAHVVGHAVPAIPGADYACITASGGLAQTKTVAATHAYPRLLHGIQNRLGEGPDVDVAATDELVRVDDLERQTRWPSFGTEAIAQTSVRSLMAFKLSTGREMLGVLHVYADQPHSFDPDVDEVGMAFATHAALAWDNARREQHFRSALESRDAIGQAKGMIMERYQVDSDAAFAMLTKMSQNSNTRVADIARELIAMDQTSARDTTAGRCHMGT